MGPSWTSPETHSVTSGIALIMGGATTTNRAIVQSAGSAYRLTKKRIELCRWLLLSLDRLNSTGSEAGVIEYRRGKITVLDRPRLESMSCECYEVVKKETDRLLPERRSSEAIFP